MTRRGPLTACLWTLSARKRTEPSLLLEEGTGLLGSTQLRRVSTDILSLEGERAFTTGLEQRGSYVVYASRPLEDEEWAVETVPSDPAPDTYLLWVPEGIELDAPSASAEGGTLYLLPQEEAPQPFLEERELAALFPGEERRNCRLFSWGRGTVRPAAASAGGSWGAGLGSLGVLRRAVPLPGKAGQGKGESPLDFAPCRQPGRAVSAPAKGGAARLSLAPGDHLRLRVL